MLVAVGRIVECEGVVRWAGARGEGEGEGNGGDGGRGNGGNRRDGCGTETEMDRDGDMEVEEMLKEVEKSADEAERVEKDVMEE